MDINYLIENEGESTNLDFKATQYRKENYFELLKDIIAMANAVTDGEKLIITGVKKKPDSTFTIIPIAEGEFVDSATYQQLVLDNIEPEIHIDYVPHQYEGQLVGVLTIPPCPNKPYMMKKLFGSERQSRKAGESFIRKGTTTFPLMRKDIDQIFERKKNEDAFSHQVSFYFSGTQKSKVLNVKPVTITKLPSQQAAEKIRSIIAKKEEEDRRIQNNTERNNFLPGFSRASLRDFDYSTPFNPAPYERRSVPTLRDNLKHVKETYREDDLYEVYEKQAEKINITILNEGSKYLEDAVIEAEIPFGEGFVVASKIYTQPSNEPFQILRVSTENVGYPRYESRNQNHVFRQSIGDLRHLQPIDAFTLPIRITIAKKLLGTEIEIKLTLFGKNLPSPIEDTLLLKIAQSDE